MCQRQKDPYKGLLNFVGGKALEGENGLDAAYRELEEETGLKRTDISIQCLFQTRYHNDHTELQVYYGVLNDEVILVDELNPLVWIPVTEAFDNETKYAGNGNIQHMMVILKEHLNIS